MDLTDFLGTVELKQKIFRKGRWIELKASVRAFEDRWPWWGHRPPWMTVHVTGRTATMEAVWRLDDAVASFNLKLSFLLFHTNHFFYLKLIIVFNSY